MNPNNTLEEFFPHHIQEEILEYLYVSLEENYEVDLNSITKMIHNSKIDVKIILDNLIKKDYVLKIDNKFRITDKGKTTGESVVRRTRLGERLLADVLALQDTDVVETACKFEHILNEGVEEAICTILGHPSYCPHGKPIPKGACCSKNSKEVDQIVVPITELTKGDIGLVRFLKTSSKEGESILKLLNFGILPGRKIELISKQPAFIISIEESTIALEKKFAEKIYVRHVTGSEI
ncbi:MAG: metal-dependent transcriptional regulator [Candidatus Hodarchaeales archaeon]|jgi:DtxR family Mn-dependent transcriptional regulator